MEIKGKVAVVTGAGSGIGQAAAIELAKRRVKAMGWRSQRAVKRVAASINDRPGSPSPSPSSATPPTPSSAAASMTRLARQARHRQHLRAGRRHHPRRPLGQARQGNRQSRHLPRSSISGWWWRSISLPRSTGPWKWSPASPRTACAAAWALGARRTHARHGDLHRLGLLAGQQGPDLLRRHQGRPGGAPPPS